MITQNLKRMLRLRKKWTSEERPATARPYSMTARRRSTSDPRSDGCSTKRWHSGETERLDEQPRFRELDITTADSRSVGAVATSRRHEKRRTRTQTNCSVLPTTLTFRGPIQWSLCYRGS